MAEPRKIRIGISSCLLGQEVRYNGGHKRDSFLTDVFGRYVEWVPVCPEVEVGLGVPRPPIHLERIGFGDGVRLIMPSTGMDLTEAMTSYAERRAGALAGLGLCGYVLKKDSPSCGMERVKVYREDGMAARDGRGTFAGVLIRRLPHLPVEEEGRLNDPLLRESFVSRVFVYDRWMEGERSGWTRASLMRFHERHKFLLMARNQTGMRRLGRLLGEAGRGDDPADLARLYLDGLTAVMRRPATRRGHTNVLLHLLGYVSDDIDRGDREELAGTIERYRQGLVPLVVPLALIRHHVRRLGTEYLQDQVYLDPHPHELMLLNHV
ncbi:MAG TPA: DUF523 and DUF1722 domain-containing protein [Thermoanaerobaculia bacterium]|nr:DUF523 and DUF1722 domain-containing protein [Thermoanaerobaculia bacterium]